MFAKLSKNIQGNFTIGEILQELVKVCCGVITSKNDLTVFDSNLSTIINSTATNWQQVFPSPLTSQSNCFVIKSQCINPAKFKYARFMVKGISAVDNYNEPTSNISTVYAQQPNLDCFLEMNTGIGFDTATSSLLNPSYYHASNEGINLLSDDLIISASSRHLLIYSQNTSSYNTIPLFACLEFPETNITQSKSLVPFISYRGKGQNLTHSTLSKDISSAKYYSVCQVPDGFNLLTNKNHTILSFGNDTRHFTTLDFGNVYIGSEFTQDRISLNNPSQRQLPARDLIIYDVSRGLNFINASTLTNVYYFANGTAFCDINSTYTFNGKSFVCLPLSTAVLLIPKE